MSDIYDFGFPDELVDIHFPTGDVSLVAQPWFWYITPQIPRYFQYLGSQVGGHGWQNGEFLPIIKILPIDTRPLVPTSQVGFGSIEEAIRRTNNGEPISQDAWGRFRFDSKGQGPGADFFFKCIGQKKPRYRSEDGLLVSQADAININIREAVQGWRDDWNAQTDVWNAAFQNVQGDGSYSVIPPNSNFALPTPRPNIPIPELQKTVGKYYFGTMPATATFSTGNALFFKSAYCFKMEVAQLDPTIWDMSVFPPKDASAVLSGRIASSVSQKFGGYNKTFKDFPQNGLNIN